MTLGLSLATVIACSDSGDDGQTAGADLSGADGGSVDGGTLTPIQQMQQELLGAWVNSGDASGPVALIMSSTGGDQLNVDRDTPHQHVAGSPTDTGITRDRTDLDLTILSVLFGNGGGTLKLSEFIFDDKTGANQRNEFYTFTLSGDTLTMTETSVTFTNDQFGGDTDAIKVDAGAQQLRPPTTFKRQPAFCGNGGKDDCFAQFSRGTFTATMPAACKDKPEVCLLCQNDHTCVAKTPSSCELARFTCVSSTEICEFGDPNANPHGLLIVGEATRVDPDGNAIDCTNSPTGKSVCCVPLGGQPPH
jgi:hypothetical protein